MQDRMRGKWIIVVGVFSLALLACLPTWGAEFKAKVIASGQGHKETLQLYLKGQRYRLHSDSDPAKGDVLVDLQTKKVDVLDPSSKQYHEFSTVNPLDLRDIPDPFEAIDRMATVFPMVRKKAATETVNGYLCDKYVISAQDGSMVLADYWVAQKLGFPPKLVFRITWDSMDLDVTEIQEGPLLDSLFQIPRGYTLAEEHGENAPPWLKDVPSAPVVGIPYQSVMSAGQIIRVKVAAGQSVDIVCKDAAEDAQFTAVRFQDGKPAAEIPENTWSMGKADPGFSLTRTFGSASGGAIEIVVRMNKASARIILQRASGN